MRTRKLNRDDDMDIDDELDDPYDDESEEDDPYDDDDDDDDDDEDGQFISNPMDFFWSEKETRAQLEEMKKVFTDAVKDVRDLQFPVVFETSKQKSDFLTQAGYPFFREALFSHQNIDGVWLCHILKQPLASVPPMQRDSDREDLEEEAQRDIDDDKFEDEDDKYEDTLTASFDEDEQEEIEEEIDPDKKRQMETLLAQYSSTYWHDLHDSTFWFNLSFDNVKAKEEFITRYNVEFDEFGCANGPQLNDNLGLKKLKDGTYRAKLTKTSKSILALVREKV